MYARAQLEGIVEDVIRYGASAYTGVPLTGGGGGSGAAPPSPSSPGGAPSYSGTTVSPAFQQSFTPQISPVFQQTQDSPGATQAATATQYAPGGQAARGGSTAPPSAAGAPGEADFPAVPQLSPTDTIRSEYFPDAVRDVMRNQPFDWRPVVWVAGIGAALVLGTMFLRQRRPAKG